MVEDEEVKNKSTLLDDIYQDNNSNIKVTQKNIIILYFDGENENLPDLKVLEKIIEEKLNMEVNEEGEVKLNDEEMEVEELGDGSVVFKVENEEVKPEPNK